jgi:predicted small lipoprotein YifL
MHRFLSRTVILLALLGGVALIQGCGNKGPLYLPSPPPQQQGAEPADNNQ